MTIILTVLKIISWLILIALVLILAVVLLVLFYPVSYRIKGDIHQKKINGDISVSWLGHLFMLRIIYSDSRSRIYVRIFGIRKNFGENPDEPDSIKKEDVISKKAPASTNTSAFSDEDSGLGDNKTKEAPTKTSDGNVSGAVKKDTLFQKIKRKWHSFWHRLSDIRHTIGRIRQTLGDSHNHAAVSHVKAETVRLLKYIMPDRLKLSMSYSTGSPDSTAQIFGILALFPIGYRNRWNIHPDFEADEGYVDGETDIKGHVYSVCLLGIFIRLIMDKNCRRLIKQFGNNKS